MVRQTETTKSYLDSFILLVLIMPKLKSLVINKDKTYSALYEVAGYDNEPDIDDETITQEEFEDLLNTWVDVQRESSIEQTGNVILLHGANVKAVQFYWIEYTGNIDDLMSAWKFITTKLAIVTAQRYDRGELQEYSIRTDNFQVKTDWSVRFNHS